MQPYIVEVNELWKVYKRQIRSAGLLNGFKSFFKPEFEYVEALKGISFKVKSGEIIGYIGLNGAGKTTTLKILSGVLYPTSGDVEVLGEIPQKRTKEFLHNISYIMSSYGFLEETVWDLPVSDGFYLIKEIYGISLEDYKRRVEELSIMMRIEDILNVPVRNLSHGERKKAEIVSNLLWQPKLILLDEPTLGLDVVSQMELREFIRAYVERYDSTIILTSHYMEDIETLADRVIMLDQGIVLYDGNIDGLKKHIMGIKYIKLSFKDSVKIPANLIKKIAGVKKVLEKDEELVLEVEESFAKDIAKEILNRFNVFDITIFEPTLEDVVNKFYQDRANNG